MGAQRSRPRSVQIASLLFVIVIITTALLSTPSQSQWRPPSTLSHLRDQLFLSNKTLYTSVADSFFGDRYAFATFFNGMKEEREKDDDDLYFVATRLLGFQLMHNKGTKSQKYPFIVFVTPQVTQRKQDRLRRDGATVITLQDLHPERFNGTTDRWDAMFTKLRFFEQTQYDRIAYFDSDTLVVSNIDAIFDDPATQSHPNLNLTDGKPDEAPQPETYVFAATSEQFEDNHGWPPKSGDYFNAGCLVFKPSLQVFQHYMSMFAIPDRFRTFFMEQDLLNYAHRRDGNMPWKSLADDWNLNFATGADFHHGVKTLHTKFWLPPDDTIGEMWKDVREKMEKFYEGWDAALDFFG